jgi:hypothetical protein
VHLNYEPQTYCSRCDDYEGIFNLTASFRRDSDFTSIYYSESGIKWSEEARPNTTVNIWQSKNAGFAAALISNPLSKRLEYIQELQKYMAIDIYGWGFMECPPNLNCREHLSRNYKFFLVFENSMCTDYITEKFFDTFRYVIRLRDR